MYEVRVEAAFSAAHFLKDYNGKCEKLHGHNYRVLAHARGDVLDKGGMLVDFSALKGALRKVCDELDHTNLNDEAFFAQNPSAERIAFFIYNKVSSILQDDAIGNVSIYAVDVYETPASRARYIASVDDEDTPQNGEEYL